MSLTIKESLLKRWYELQQVIKTVLDGINTGVSTSNTELTDINTELDNVSTELATVNTNLDSLEVSNGSIDTKLTTTNSELATANTSLDNVELYTLRDIDVWDKIVGNSIETAYTDTTVTARNPRGDAGLIDTKTYKTGAGVTTVVTIEYTYEDDGAASRLIKTEAV